MHNIRRFTNHLTNFRGNIPETWNTLQDFFDWYVGSGMPIIVPHDYEVYVSDDALSIPLFRKGQFQVELYLIKPGPLVPSHEHPGVEVIKYRGGTYMHTKTGSVVPNRAPVASDVLLDGFSHGAGFILEGETRGFPLFAIQKWKDGLTPCTVAARWKGKTVGPLQEALVRRFYPNSFVVPGYADVTKDCTNINDFAYRSSGNINVSIL